jgi:hypothetical protein
MKIKIEIKNRFTGKIIFEFETENNTIAKTVNEYIKQFGTRANLTGANLYEANLYGANLYGADLTGANLTRANLYEANLYEANLYGADLTGANLTRANLTGANLTGANLYEANLTGANLYEANLTGANLTGANLDRIKYDFFGRMLMQKHEIPTLRENIISGNIDGSCYEGKCACFVGTIANAKHENYQFLNLKPDANSTTERWFLAFKPGLTPENNQITKITLQWVDEFLTLIK